MGTVGTVGPPDGIEGAGELVPPANPPDFLSRIGLLLSIVCAFLNLAPFLMSPKSASLAGGGAAGDELFMGPPGGGGGGGGAGGPAIVYNKEGQYLY